MNKEPLCTGGPGTRPRLQPAARAKQTGTVWSEGGQADGRTETRPPLGESRSQGLSWELGAARGLPAPRVESSPSLPQPNLHRGRTVPSLIHPRGRTVPSLVHPRGCQRRGWQSAGDSPGRGMSDSPFATAVPRTGKFQSRKHGRKPALVLKKPPAGAVTAQGRGTAEAAASPTWLLRSPRGWEQPRRGQLLLPPQEGEVTFEQEETWLCM